MARELLRCRNLSGNALAGTLPAAWSALRDLTVLDVAANRLTGGLPIAWSHMELLQELYLARNSLAGDVHGKGPCHVAAGSGRRGPQRAYSTLPPLPGPAALQPPGMQAGCQLHGAACACYRS